MTMNSRKTIIAALVAALSAAPLAVAPLHAQAQAQAQAPRTFSQAELDQMLAPIALYPDPLLSQILMASTYPIEVVEAARWTRSNPGLKGDAAVRAVQNEDWDPSVKSLVAFPQILQRMDEQLEWTRSLGDAFLAQEPQLMEEVQVLRRRAHAAGNLRSDEQIQVEQQGQNIVVQPASPQVVYVPYYDPLVVYGPWWWPAYQPVVWAPWPGYVRPYYPGVSVGFWWGAPVSLSVGFFFGNFDWHHRHVRVVHPTAYYYRPPVVVVNRTVVVDRTRWQHDPHHRRQVEYRAPEVRQRYASAQVERRDVQREERRETRGLPRRDVQGERRPAARVQSQSPAPVPSQQSQTRPATQQQQRQQAESARFRQQQQREQSEASRARQRQQADSARFQQQQRQKAEASRAQQRQQADSTRFQQRQQQERQEQRAAMPAAKAPQTPRAERHEQRQEQRQGQREERRQERGQKS